MERLFLPPGDEGRIDAFFAVIGKPYDLLSSKDPRLSKLSLVSVNHNRRISPIYKKTEITTSDYHWLERTVGTISVSAVLVTFDFSGDHCDNVAMIARQISDNLDDLRRSGHLKWAQVDLEGKIPGWKPYSCVTKRMDLPLERSATCTFVPCSECMKFDDQEFERCRYFKCSR